MRCVLCLRLVLRVVLPDLFVRHDCCTSVALDVVLLVLFLLAHVNGCYSRVVRCSTFFTLSLKGCLSFVFRSLLPLF